MKATERCEIVTGGKTVGYLLAATIAFGAATTAQAEYFDWKGNASGTSYFDDTNCWGGNKGNHAVSSADNHWIGYGNNVVVSGWDGVITSRSFFSCGGAFNVLWATAPIVFVAEDAEYGINFSGSFNVYNGAEVQIQSGTYSFGSYIQIGYSSAVGINKLTINGGTVKNTGAYMAIAQSTGSTGIVTVATGAVYENRGSNGNMTIGHGAGATGTLNIEGGEVTIRNQLLLCYGGGAACRATVNVTDGGVLIVNKVVQTRTGTSGSYLTLDGGTLKAYAGNADFMPAYGELHFYVGANGGVIDTDGFDVTFGEDIENVAGESGAVRFTGGGTVTLTGAVNCASTTIDAGTRLLLTPAAKTALFANGVAVAIPAGGAADGVIVMEIADGGSFTQSDIDDHVTISGDSAGRYAPMLVDNGTKIALADTLAGEYVWNGGSSGASWKTPGSWTKNGIAGNWYDSTAAVFENAGDAAAVDSNVAAASVTFRENTTITGSATLSAGVVAVSNGVAASISGPTSGAMEKTGPGTLTLSSSRTEQTTLTEGTLILTGSDVTLDGSRLTLGNVAGSSVALRLENGASLGSLGSLGLGSADGGSASLYSTGNWSASGDMILGSGLNASGEYIHAGGTLAIGGHIYIGNNAASDSARSYLEVSGGAIDFTARKHIFMGNQGAAGSRSEMVVKNDARVTPGMSIVVGNKAGATLTLTNDAYVVTGSYDAGGHITLASESSHNGDDCVLNLFGGVLETLYVAHGNSPGRATINFDGGTLKAQSTTTTFISAHNKLDVVVGPKGGTIDSAGVNVTVAEPLTGTGGMTFAGGGTVTLSAAPTYSDKTTVELGTTLVVPAAIAGADLEIAIPEGLPSGIYKVVAISGNGVFADNILSTATLPTGNLKFYLNEGKTEIWCMYSSVADAHVWIGGASNSLNDGANWLSGNVPADGTAVICCATEATLTNPEGSAFAATTIVFPTNTAPITVSGEALAGVVAIVNDSASEVEFANAVTFAENIDVVQNPGAVKFSGGATGVKLARRTDIHGTYTLTVSGNHTEIAQTTVKSDGVYLLPNATFYKHNGDFHIEAGGRAQVKNARIATKSGATLLGTNDGEFKVDGEFLVEGNGGTPTHYTGGGTGTFIANKIRVIQGGYIVPVGSTGKMVIGADGIIRGDGYVRVSNNGSHWIGSCADWTMYYNALGANTAMDKFVVYKHNSSTTWSTVTFDTTDFYDDTIGRTITSESLIGAANAASAAKFKVNVTGIGKFVFANTVVNDNIFSGGLTVTNSATVSVVPGARPGNGDVTLEDNSTLQVAKSGTVTLGGNLTLADGAALAFNFTDRSEAPVLALASDKTVTLGSQSNVVVKISAADDLRPKGDTYTLTSGGKFAGATAMLVPGSSEWVKGVSVNDDGDIVLTLKRRSTFIVVR